MKYLIVLNRDNDERAILFDDSIIHKDMARIHRARDNDIRVISAGFCMVDRSNTIWKVHTYGRSDSLNMDTREQDKFIIEFLFTGGN